MFEAQQIPLELLLEAEWNANRVPPPVLAKVRRSIEQHGVVENLVARPHPSEAGKFELLSGNHRLRCCVSSNMRRRRSWLLSWAMRRRGCWRRR